MQRCLSPRSNHAAPTLFFSYFLLPNPVLTGQWTRPAWTCILYSDNSQKAGAGAALSTHPCENFGGKLQPPNTIELFYREYIAACKPGRAEKGFPMFILLLGEGEVGENCKTVAFLITKDRQEGKHSNSTWISQPWWSFSWAWKGQSSWGAVTAGAEGKPDSHGIPRHVCPMQHRAGWRNYRRRTARWRRRFSFLFTHCSLVSSLVMQALCFFLSKLLLCLYPYIPLQLEVVQVGLSDSVTFFFFFSNN